MYHSILTWNYVPVAPSKFAPNTGDKGSAGLNKITHLRSLIYVKQCKHACVHIAMRVYISIHINMNSIFKNYMLKRWEDRLFLSFALRNIYHFYKQYKQQN